MAIHSISIVGVSFPCDLAASLDDSDHAAHPTHKPKVTFPGVSLHARRDNSLKFRRHHNGDFFSESTANYTLHTRSIFLKDVLSKYCSSWVFMRAQLSSTLGSSPPPPLLLPLPPPPACLPPNSSPPNLASLLPTASKSDN